jgi:hypothetical protein
LSPHEFIDTLMFSELDHSQLSLQDCCNDLHQQYQKKYSKVALHNRFDETAVAFLKSVLSKQLANHPIEAPDCLWSSFNRILIGDSCKFSIAPELAKDYPGLYNGLNGAKALMNLQYSFDLKSGQWQYLEFTRATENDQSHSPKIMDAVQANDLLIRDLGYVTHDYLRSITDRKAWFINRMPPKWTPLQVKNNQPIDWRSVHRKIKKHKLHFIEIDVITGGKAFKTWKSILLIHKSKPVKKHRLECQLLAKFIWILLNWKIFNALKNFILEYSPDNSCSMWKFFKQSKHHAYSLRMVTRRKLTFEQWCKLFIYPIIQGVLIEPKKDKPPHHTVLNQVFA